MTWTEPEVQIAEAPLVRFAFGSLSEETDYDYEVSLDPTFSTGVFGGQFRTTAVQNDVRLAGITLAGTALDLSGFDLSVATDLTIETTTTPGTKALAATAEAGAATVAVSVNELTVNAAGSYPFTVTITNQTSSRTYNVYLVITELIMAVNIDYSAVASAARDIAGDGTHLFFLYPGPTLHAYRLSDGQRDSDADLVIPSTATTDYLGLRGAAVTDTRFYAIGTLSTLRRMLVMNRSDGTFVSDESFFLTQAPAAADFALHGTTAYVLDIGNKRVHRYNLTTKAQIDQWSLHADNNHPSGIWSNGDDVWISDTDDDKIFVYSAGGVREPAGDFDLIEANSVPSGLWSDGTIMYVDDQTDRIARVYDLATGAYVGA